MTPGGQAAAGGAGRRRLRVCMVHHSDFHVDSRIQRQARALAERGDEVHLVCLSRPAELREGAGRIVVHAAGSRKASGGARGYLQAYGGFVARATARVAALDRRHGFDVVEAHNMPDAVAFAGLLPRLRGAALILNVHDTFPELFATTFGRRAGSAAERLVMLEERMSMAVADAVVAVTAEAAGVLAGRGAEGRTAVVMNSPDRRVFGPPRPVVLPPADGPLRVAYHGGLAARFGVEDLVRAIGRLEGRARLLVLGDGPERARLRSLAADVAPDLVELPGSVPVPEVPRALAGAHVGVVPTRSDRFTRLLLPVKLLEYVHLGLPVVAARLPTIERYFGAGEVGFFEPGRPDDLAGALDRVLADPSAARQRAVAAGRRLRPLAWEQQRAAYLGLVDRLAAEARRGQRRSCPVTGPSTEPYGNGTRADRPHPLVAQA